MCWEVVGWGVLVLVLFVVEVLVLGVFMLWIGIGVVVVFVLVVVFVDILLLWQVVVFVLFSVVLIQCYWCWGCFYDWQSDVLLLNWCVEQLVGWVVLLDQLIVVGKGCVKVDDVFWVVDGLDLLVGSVVWVVVVVGMMLKV